MARDSTRLPPSVSTVREEDDEEDEEELAGLRLDRSRDCSSGERASMLDSSTGALRVERAPFYAVRNDRTVSSSEEEEWVDRISSLRFRFHGINSQVARTLLPISLPPSLSLSPMTYRCWSPRAASWRRPSSSSSTRRLRHHRGRASSRNEMAWHGGAIAGRPRRLGRGSRL